MAHSILTQELVQSLFEYKDGELYWKVNKGSAKIGDKTGSLHHSGYLCIQINSKTYLAHRVIFLYHHGFLPQYIDHIDGNKSNNKIENLREATIQQNGFNTKLYKTSTSGIKGVDWSKKAKKWQVRVQINNKRKYFGIYENIELAELVAIEARNKYHGNFARHQ
jgi:hypothetical protein